MAIHGLYFSLAIPTLLKIISWSRALTNIYEVKNICALKYTFTQITINLKKTFRVCLKLILKYQ